MYFDDPQFVRHSVRIRRCRMIWNMSVGGFVTDVLAQFFAPHAYRPGFATTAILASLVGTVASIVGIVAHYQRRKHFLAQHSDGKE